MTTPEPAVSPAPDTEALRPLIDAAVKQGIKDWDRDYDSRASGPVTNYVLGALDYALREREAGLRADLDRARTERDSMVRDLLTALKLGPMPDRPLDTVWTTLLKIASEQEDNRHATAMAGVRDRLEVKQLRAELARSAGARTIPDDAAGRKLNEAIRLVTDLVDGEPCRLDHNGNCQEHYSFGYGEYECVDARAKRWLKTLDDGATPTTDPDVEWEHRHDPAEDIGCSNPPAVSCSDAGCPRHGHDTEEGDTDE